MAIFMKFDTTTATSKLLGPQLITVVPTMVFDSNLPFLENTHLSLPYLVPTEMQFLIIIIDFGTSYIPYIVLTLIYVAFFIYHKNSMK